MADIKVIYKNASGFDQEHSESADSIKLLSLKLATTELTDTHLSNLIGGSDIGSTEHNHDGIYFREAEFINASAGASDAAKPIKTNSAGQVDSTFINVSAISHSGLSNLSADDHTQYLKTDGTRNITGVQAYSSSVTISSNNQVPHKKYVDDSIAAAIVGQEWLFSAGTRAVTPPGSPAVGQRVLIDATLGAPTGAFVGHDDSIAQWSGSAWTYQVPTTGTFISVDAETTVLYYFGGSAWSSKAFESTTASTGLTKVGMDLRLDSSAAGSGLGFSSGVLDVNVDSSSIEINADTLRVKALGIKDSMIDFGTGALQVSAVDLPIADAANVITATNVEAALQELTFTMIGVPYLAGETLAYGDLVYISSNNTVSKLSTLTSNAQVVGIALGAASTGAGVYVRKINGVQTGLLSGATAGAKYYWSGSALTSTIPSGAGANVWQVGTAKNATDLVLEVAHIKKNA